eukprot:873606_1
MSYLICICNCCGIDCQQVDTVIRKTFKYSNLCFRIVDILNHDVLITCKTKKDQQELNLSRIWLNGRAYRLFIPTVDDVNKFKQSHKQQYGSLPNLNFNNNNRRKSRRKTCVNPKKK